jgi:hypothetical protein
MGIILTERRADGSKSESEAHSMGSAWPTNMAEMLRFEAST